MRRKSSLSISVIVIFFQLNALDSISESSQTDKDQKVLQHEVTVTLKLVQVYVIDKKGLPVTDLEKDDFELYDNGKRQFITDFEKHLFSQLSFKTAPHQRKAKAMPAKKINRKFFLFFDFAFNNRFGLEKSKEAALHFIDTQLQLDDEVGVISYSTKNHLTLHEYLTKNHLKVRQVVEGFESNKISGRAKDVEEEYWRIIKEEEDIESGKIIPSKPRPVELSKWDIGLHKMETELERRKYQYHVIKFISHTKELTKALRYIPGHKHIILFSSGIVSSVIYDTPGIDSLRYRDKIDESNLLETKYETMIKELAASNCPVYALDAGKLASVIPKSISVTGVHSLKRLAEITGGKYFKNVENYKTIMEEIQNITGSFYILGYYIDEKLDGKYHKLKVKVKRKGCEVHTQSGYYNPKPFAEYSKLEKAIHLVDLALTEKPHFQIPFRFPLKALFCSIKRESILALISKISRRIIKEVSDKEVEVVILIFNEKDNIVALKRKEYNFSSLSKRSIYYYSFSYLSPGTYKCRVVIRNLKTGKAAVASSSVTIPETYDVGLRLDTPLLLIPEKNALYLKVSTIKKKETRKASFTLLKIYPYDYTEYSPLIGDLKQGTSRILVMLRCYILDIRQPDIKLSARLVHQSTGKAIPSSFSILDKYQYNNIQIYLLELQLNEMLPGRYFLSFFAKETKTKFESHVATDLIVK